MKKVFLLTLFIVLNITAMEQDSSMGFRESSVQFMGVVKEAASNWGTDPQEQKQKKLHDFCKKYLPKLQTSAMEGYLNLLKEDKIVAVRAEYWETAAEIEKHYCEDPKKYDALLEPFSQKLAEVMFEGDFLSSVFRSMVDHFTEPEAREVHGFLQDLSSIMKQNEDESFREEQKKQLLEVCRWDAKVSSKAYKKYLENKKSKESAGCLSDID